MGEKSNQEVFTIERIIIGFVGWIGMVTAPIATSYIRQFITRNTGVSSKSIFIFASGILLGMVGVLLAQRTISSISFELSFGSNQSEEHGHAAEQSDEKGHAVEYERAKRKRTQEVEDDRAKYMRSVVSSTLHTTLPVNVVTIMFLLLSIISLSIILSEISIVFGFQTYTLLTTIVVVVLFLSPKLRNRI